MKAFMWRKENGEWVYMLGYCRDVADARASYKRGGRMANRPYALGLNSAATIARAHAIGATKMRNDPNRSSLPLAA